MAKILIIVSAYLPQRIDGTVITARELAHAYGRQGHQVTIFCRNVKVHASRPEESTLQQDIIEDLTVLRLVVPQDQGILESLDNPTVFSLFLALINADPPDAVHVHHLEQLSSRIVAQLASRSIPLVLTLHDFYVVCPTVQLITNGGRLCDGPDQGHRCARCYPAMAKTNIPRHSLPGLNQITDHVSAISQRYHREFVERYQRMQALLAASIKIVSPSSYLARIVNDLTSHASPITVIPNGCDLYPTSRPMLNGSPPVIGFIGALSKAKGLHVLTSALRNLTRINWTLHVHGTGSQSYARSCVSTLPPGRGVLRGGFFPDQAQQIMESIDILVVPSVWPENCPLVVLQALATQVPCVVAGWGGMAELITDGVNGLHFTPGDPHDLSVILGGLLLDHRRIQALAQGAAHSRPAGWDAVASQYLALLLEPTARHQSGHS